MNNYPIPFFPCPLSSLWLHCCRQVDIKKPFSSEQNRYEKYKIFAKASRQMAIKKQFNVTTPLIALKNEFMR